jgi:hypothetical protein
MSLRERIEWVFRMGLLVFILASAAFLSAVTAMRFAIQGREVTMPNLVGKSSADALAILQGRGLQLKVVDRVYSDLPANAVARQSPPEGERMKVAQNAHVVLSLGPQNVTTPSLVGESLRVARIQLLQIGLQLGEVTTFAAPAVQTDTILQQTPLPGMRACLCRTRNDCSLLPGLSCQKLRSFPLPSGPRARSRSRHLSRVPRSRANQPSRWLWHSRNFAACHDDSSF